MNDKTFDPIECVDRIFKRLAATYGAAWSRSLGDTPIVDIKTVWAHELAGYLQNRETMKAIAYGLDNLPDNPPNVKHFKALCRMAVVEVPALPLPPADPIRMRAEMEKLAPVRESISSNIAAKDCRAWARAIIARRAAGVPVTPTVLQMAKDALGASE